MERENLARQRARLTGDIVPENKGSTVKQGIKCVVVNTKFGKQLTFLSHLCTLSAKKIRRKRLNKYNTGVKRIAFLSQ